MNIQILMLTHNRAAYTRISLGGLLETLPEYAQVTVWDNASNQETKDVIASFEGHPRLAEVVYSPENKKLREPTNWFWEKHRRSADFVSKIDDDCLQQPGWIEALLKVHEAIPETGVAGTWRFYPEDNVNPLPTSKVIERNGVKLMLNCWVQGSGYLLRTEVIEVLGLLRENDSFPRYCTRSAKVGYLNGFAYPFIFEDHFDDPRSVHSLIKTDDDLNDYLPLSARVFGIDSVENWTDHQKREAKFLQETSWRASDHMGVRSKLTRKACAILGRPYEPKAS